MVVPFFFVSFLIIIHLLLLPIRIWAEKFIRLKSLVPESTYDDIISAVDDFWSVKSKHCNTDSSRVWITREHYVEKNHIWLDFMRVLWLAYELISRSSYSFWYDFSFCRRLYTIHISQFIFKQLSFFKISYTKRFSSPLFRLLFWVQHKVKQDFNCSGKILWPSLKIRIQNPFTRAWSVFITKYRTDSGLYLYYCFSIVKFQDFALFPGDHLPCKHIFTDIH